MRLSIPDLLPSAEYALQVRAVGKNKTSEWSPRFRFKATVDNVPPRVPQNVTWEISGEGFHGEWDSVTHNIAGRITYLSRYEVELSSFNQTKIISVSPASVLRMNYDLTFGENMLLFDGAVAEIGMRVRAVDIRDLKSEWSEQIIAQNEPPDPPTNLTGKEGVLSITLNWDASPSTDVKGYNVYQGPGANPTNLVSFVNSTTFTTTVDATTPQYFAITAVDRFGLESTPLAGGPWVAEDPFIVDATPPAVPTGLAATITNNANGIGAVAALTWTNGPEADRQGIEISWKRNADSVWANSTVVGKDQTSATINLNEAYTSYDFRIRAFDTSANYSAWSAVLTKAAVANTAPPQVTGLTAVPGMDSIRYNWTGSTATDLRHYELVMSTSSTFASGNTTFFTGTANSLTVSGLNPDTTYYARVRAVDTGGLVSAAWSATNTTKTNALPDIDFEPSDGLPPASSPTPTGSGGIGYINVSWTPVPNNDLVTYEVHLGTTAGFTPSAATKVGEAYGTSMLVRTLPGTNTPLAYNTNYYFKTIAKDVDDAAAPSAASAAIQAKKAGSGDVSITPGDIGATTPEDIEDIVLDAANGINRIYWSTSAASGTSKDGRNFVAGDTWFQTNTSGKIIGQWEFTTSWQAREISDEVIASLNVGKLVSGSLESAIITVGDGGEISSNLYATSGGSQGFRLTDDSLEIRSGVVHANTLVSGSGILDDLIIESGGAIQSSVFNTTHGFKLDHTGLTIRGEGSVIAADAIRAGNLGGPSGTNSIINITAGTSLVMNGGHIKSNTNSGTNFDTAVTSNAGFYLGHDGLFIAGGSGGGRIKADALTTGTLQSSTITIGNGGSIAFSGTGSISATGFVLNSTGLTLTGGSISGAASIDAGAIKTGSLTSTNTTGVGGAPVWSIPMNGAATFHHLIVRGTSIVGDAADTTQSVLRSRVFTSGSSGWQIDAGGNAEFNNATVRGTVYASNGEFTGKVTATSGTFYGGITATSGSIAGTLTFGANGKIVLTGQQSAKIEMSAGSITGYAPNGIESFMLDANTGIIKTTSESGAAYAGSIQMGQADPINGFRMYSANDPNYPGSAGYTTFWLNPRANVLASVMEVRGRVEFMPRPGNSFPNSTLFLIDSQVRLSVQSNVVDFASSPIFNSGLTLNGAIDSLTGDILVSPNNGAGRIYGGGNINVAFGTNFTPGAAITIHGGKVSATASGMNAANATAQNTVQFFANKVNGFGAYVNASDEREKNTIEAVDPDKALDVIRRTKVRSFYMNHVDPDRQQFGVIAQEMEDVLPSAITPIEESLGFSYQDLWAMHLAATQVLVGRVETLESERDDLASRVDKLEATVNQLLEALDK